MPAFRCAGWKLFALIMLVGLSSAAKLSAQQCVSPALKSISVDPTLGTEPREMALGELDHDGFPDLAVLDTISNDVSIMRGNGIGFATIFNLPFLSAADVVLGDFNHDGWDDVAVSGVLDKKVYVQLANGAGGFNPVTSFDVGTGPTELNAGDFNRDGDLDLVVYNTTDKTILVLKGDGFGGFAALSPVPGVSAADQMATADLNHDDKLDVVTADSTGNRIWVALGDGAGGFPSILPSGRRGADVRRRRRRAGRDHPAPGGFEPARRHLGAPGRFR